MTVFMDVQTRKCGVLVYCTVTDLQERCNVW